MCKYSLSNKMDNIAKYKISIGQRDRKERLWKQHRKKQVSNKRTYYNTKRTSHNET